MDDLGGCLVLLLMLILGFGLSALLTLLVSLTGVITFTWTNVLIVWGILIVLKMIF